MKVPKQDWLCFPMQTPKPVPKVHIVIATPIETLKERPSYAQPVPFPSTMRIYIFMDGLVEQKEAEEKTRKEKEEEKVKEAIEEDIVEVK
jgi:hypothetical protein